MYIWPVYFLLGVYFKHWYPYLLYRFHVSDVCMSKQIHACFVRVALFQHLDIVEGSWLPKMALCQWLTDQDRQCTEGWYSRNTVDKINILTITWSQLQEGYFWLNDVTTHVYLVFQIVRYLSNGKVYHISFNTCRWFKMYKYNIVHWHTVHASFSDAQIGSSQDMQANCVSYMDSSLL